MVSIFTNQYDPNFVSPPGETLQELLDERQMTQVRFADRIGHTPKFVNEVIKGKASITPNVAIAFERVLGIPSSFWNNRQRHHDAFVARRDEVRELSKNLQWAGKFPYNEMSKKDWVPKSREKMERLKNLLNFFGVATPKAWEQLWAKESIAFKRPKKIDSFALNAWLRQGEIEAQEIHCSPFKEQGFKACLEEVKSLTTKSPGIFRDKLISICSINGVAVVFVPELPKTAHGATRWLSTNKALLQLSLRYRTNDLLWFTFFHEAAHILLHEKKKIHIETYGINNDQENEADRFAANLLISPPKFAVFKREHTNKQFSKRSILDFARELGIAPGIVVGRLQHEKLLPQSYCNDLKQRYTWVN